MPSARAVVADPAMIEPLTYPNTLHPLEADPAAAVPAGFHAPGAAAVSGTSAATVTASPIPGSAAVHDRDGAPPEMLLVLTDCKKPITYAPRSQATLVRNRIGSAKRASAEIGFNADIDLMDGLKRLIEWRAAHKSEVADRRRAVGLAV